MRSKSSSKSRRGKKPKPNPMDSLTDDLVVDILSRLPVKSLCRCKGVSRRWRSLITHRDHRRKFRQTLPNLFYCSLDSSRFPEKVRHCTNVWEGPRRLLVSPSLSFMPAYEHMSIVDCYKDMLLCRFSTSNLHDAFRYVVCDPIAMKWYLLPESGCGANKRVVRLAGLYVFEFVYSEDDQYKVVGANIYSAEAGTWSYKEGGWFEFDYLFNHDRSVYFNGYLFIVTNKFELLVVDVEGDVWCTIPLPCPEYDPCESYFSGFIGIYKEQLCYIGEVEYNQLSVWILEDISKDDWVMKHQVSLEVLCEKEIDEHKSFDCDVVGILQDCNFILYVVGRTLMAYDADSEEVHVIQNLEKGCFSPYFLYVPSYRVTESN